MTTPSQARIPELDGIRGTAIVLVLSWHYLVVPLSFDAGPLVLPIKLVLGATWSGVDLFFVLSGFLIGGILLDNRAATRYFKAFYARRIARITPVYGAWLILFLMLSATALTQVAALQALFFPAFPIWIYATYTQNFAMALNNNYRADWLAITWSLAIEEQFYLLLPFMVRVLSPRRLIAALLGLSAAAPVLRAVLVVTQPAADLAPYVLMPCRADALLLGVLAAYLIRQPHWRLVIARHTRALYGAVIGFALIIAGLSILPGTRVSFVVVGYSSLALMYTSVILIAITEQRGPISFVMRLRPLRALGTVAYGVYLFHQTINGLWHGLVLNQTPLLAKPIDFVVTLAALATTLVIAQVSWRVFERPLVNLGRKVSYV